MSDSVFWSTRDTNSLYKQMLPIPPSTKQDDRLWELANAGFWLHETQ